MKMPFVVTMSVAASACGGTFIDSNQDAVETGGEGGGGTGGANQDTGGANHGTGGQWYPGGAGGWSTGGAIAAGGYVAAGGAIAAGGYVAAGGYLSMGGSVNPPYPPYMCPVEPPIGGTACFQPMDCAYPGIAYCMSSRTFFCENGTWTENDIWIPTCNPPPPPPVVCPPIEPTQGQACNDVYGSPYSGPDCGYGNCYGSPTTFWRCMPSNLDPGFSYAWVQAAVASCNPPPPVPGAGGAAADAGAAIPPNP